MEIVKSRSSEAQPSRIIGPTMILINKDQEVEIVKDEMGEYREDYVCTQYRISPGEYELVRAGVLPDGASWDEELRRIERSALLDAADIRIAEMEDHVATGEGGESAIQALREYKMAVRSTVTQSGFPGSVEYPDIPKI